MVILIVDEAVGSVTISHSSMLDLSPFLDTVCIEFDSILRPESAAGWPIRWQSAVSGPSISQNNFEWGCKGSIGP